eukprot:1158947-Pelagomonas_calceolata.AAC.3
MGFFRDAEQPTDLAEAPQTLGCRHCEADQRRSGVVRAGTCRGAHAGCLPGAARVSSGMCCVWSCCVQLSAHIIMHTGVQGWSSISELRAGVLPNLWVLILTTAAGFRICRCNMRVALSHGLGCFVCPGTSSLQHVLCTGKCSVQFAVLLLGLSFASCADARACDPLTFFMCYQWLVAPFLAELLLPPCGADAIPSQFDLLMYCKVA